MRVRVRACVCVCVCVCARHAISLSLVLTLATLHPLNQPLQTWLRELSTYLATAGRRATIERLVEAGQIRAHAATLTTDKRERFVRLISKLVEFQNFHARGPTSAKLGDEGGLLNNMKKKINFDKAVAQRKRSIDIPDENVHAWRKRAAKHIVSWLEDMLPRIRSLRKGSRRVKSLTPQERKLLASCIPTLVLLLARPARPCDLAGLTLKDCLAWQSTKLFVKKSLKPSSSVHDMFLTLPPLLGHWVAVYVDEIRDFLIWGRQQINSSSGVATSDLAHAASCLALEEAQFITACVKKGHDLSRSKKFNKCALVVTFLQPDGGWATEGLTSSKLTLALARSEHNQTLFVDPRGKSLQNVGYYVRFCTHHFTGLCVGPTTLRKWVSSSLGHAGFVARALDHSPGVHTKYYTAPRMDDVAAEWQRAYTLEAAPSPANLPSSSSSSAASPSPLELKAALVQAVKKHYPKGRISWNLVRNSSPVFSSFSTEKLRLLHRTATKQSSYMQLLQNET